LLLGDEAVNNAIDIWVNVSLNAHHG